MEAELNLDPDSNPDPELITDPDPNLQIISDPGRIRMHNTGFGSGSAINLPHGFGPDPVACLLGPKNKEIATGRIQIRAEIFDWIRIRIQCKHI